MNGNVMNGNVMNGNVMNGNVMNGNVMDRIVIAGGGAAGLAAAETRSRRCPTSGPTSTTSRSRCTATRRRAARLLLTGDVRTLHSDISGRHHDRV
jgi:hypothetical protein